MTRYSHLAVLLCALATATSAAAADHEPILSSSRRAALSLGTLIVPGNLRVDEPLPLVVFFHGANFPGQAANRLGTAVISISWDSNSDPYSAVFAQSGSLPKLIAEAESRSGLRFGTLVLGCFSAGCGAVRSALKDDAIYERVQSVLALDGIYADYQGRGVSESNMDVWMRLAKDAIVGRKQFLVTHTQVEPPHYAGARETADWLLGKLGMKRAAATKAVHLSEAGLGAFLVKGFAGIDGPSHFAQLNLIAGFLREMLRVD